MATTTIGPALPQVNLLPPEVRAARGLRRIKGWLGLGLLVTVLLCGGAYAFALFSAGQAADELVLAQAETTRLQAEQAKYAEVPQVLGALASSKAVRLEGMSTEVDWKAHLDAITAVLPADVGIETFAMSGATPTTAASMPSNPLQVPNVGLISFTGSSGTLPDTAAWVDALNSIPGFADAWVSSAMIGELDGRTVYTTSSTVQFTVAAYTNRFAVEGSE
ncbi:fimbrial assembly protein [Pengzhenrongella frigida]|uniref:Fimbrial assembly protein n=1 Tax=Pengzhenrongella frigida TaxID=1259133 RepID=A0A4Q5N3Q7_9MICO|nr:fimbrial assembly protein [Cellulomonas sp. HLT2-17]RYV52868.1 fimbrial assembly protein [Cellulomonas sp. HLT2-17]